MLPLTGPTAAHYARSLNWAVANVNRAGGIRGRPISLLYRDTARASLSTVATELAGDPSVVAVIGPVTSSETYEVAPAFFDANKVFVSPAATSADLDRAFIGYPELFWRTVGSDVGQARALLDAAVSSGARSLAFVTTTDDYGTTFFDWLAFLANELGVTVTFNGQFDPATQSCAAMMDAALATGPQALIATPAGAGSALCMADEWRAHQTQTRLFFTDSGEDPSVAAALSSIDPQLEGTGPAPDPAQGFARAYTSRFHTAPSPYAANTYDAVLLLSLGLEESQGKGGSALVSALSSLTEAHRGERTSWTASGIRASLKATESGDLPVVSGAAGPLLDQLPPPTPVSTTYALWRMSGSAFAPIAFYANRGGVGVVNSQEQFESLAIHSSVLHNTGSGGVLPAKTSVWALLVAASDGWNNYRHQADVMAQYQILRKRGVPASHIVVVMANDLADNPSNPKRGYVPYSLRSTNLQLGLHVDYPIGGFTATDLSAILEGQASPELRYVLHSGPSDDVYLYVAGHGNAKGIYFDLNNQVPVPAQSYSLFAPALLQQTLSQMSAAHRYRRMLIVLDACQAGTFASAVTAPGALIASSSNASEDSLAANYDIRDGTWLADQFSYDLYQQERNDPTQSLASLFEGTLYDEVSGSHVTVAGPNFGSPLLNVRLSEFITP